MPRVRKTFNGRIGVIQVFVVIWVAAICWKLVHLQVTQHEDLLERAERQQQASIYVTPKRGVIYDRNGSELARSSQVKSLYASPAEITEPETVAEKLARILDIDYDTIYKRLTSRNVAVIAIKRKLSDEELSKVGALGLPGLLFLPEMKRFYVTGPTAAHVLGFVDFEEHGKSGIEQSYEQLICGTGGRLVLEVDALKKSYDHESDDSVPGANVTLTIDAVIQHYVESALAAALRSTGSRAGTIVVMRPSTGEILALANAPTFDPNKVSQSNDTSRCNRAVEVAFEPGSVFKIVTYSAALEEGLIRPNTLIDCGNGELKMAGRVIHDGHRGVLTAAQALAKSSNVAAIKIGQRLGNERLASYIEAFGFGRRTGIELPAESRGVVHPVSEWTQSSIGSIPMGHEIGVTAVQAVAAVACIANGGEWVRPFLVKQVTSSSGEVLEEPLPERRRVVSEATAATLKAMLEGVVVQGTGKQARIGGYRAAGKTGTAQKIDEATGRYSQTRYVASFAGFAPVENPEIACIVSLDEPRGVHLGGETAAPVFARVVAEILHILGVPREDHPRENLVAADIRVYDAPISVFERTGDPYGANEREPVAAPDENAPSADHDPASKLPSIVVAPDLVGRGIREAAALCNKAGLRLKATGDGAVASQVPMPGKLVARNAVCSVRLSTEAGGAERPRWAGNTAKTAARGQPGRIDNH